MKRHVDSTSAMDANQQYLIAEFARLKQRLTNGTNLPAACTASQTARGILAAPAPIDVVSHRFGLSAFERDILLLCAGIEMDGELASCCAEHHAGLRRPLVTFALTLATLDGPHWSAITPAGALRRWRMIEVDEDVGLTRGRLRIDERVLHYIAGIQYIDRRLQAFIRKTASVALGDEHRQTWRAIFNALNADTSPPAVFLHGDDPDGKKDVAAEVAAALRLELLCISAEDLPSSCSEIHALSVLWEREAALSGGVLLVESAKADLLRPVTELAERISTLVFISSPEAFPVQRRSLHFIVNKPGPIEQKRLWEQALGPARGRLNGSLDQVAAHFRLSARTILSTGSELRSEIAASDEPDVLLWHACRSTARVKLNNLAQRLEPKAVWDDLVLPPAQKTTLRQLAAQAKHRLTVYGKWGFDAKDGRGFGVTALFAGESGTGKTMAAEVLAQDLRLDLFRIDLSSVISKYIGETEKNLSRLFDAAEDSGAMLLFDEADALFGKRSEVRDSHDRYANIEVSHLLQRMESYRGVAILTTNAKSAIDSAFERRLRFIVQFPFPDQQRREAIWRRIFPAAAPVDRTLDYAKLAKLNMSGGSIRNIAVNAAFFAAESDTSIAMNHLLQAAQAEAAKRDRTISDAEIRGWI
jgi:hypothetical protein